MKILITGIDGFTGKYLESFLCSKGFRVFGITVNPSEKDNYAQCDLRDKSKLENIVLDISPDYIFHLAAISFVGDENKLMMYDVNVIGTQNLLDASMKLKTMPKKIIIASSATVYGNQKHYILHEEMCPNPINHYGYSKLSMEHLVATYFNRLNIVMTRPFNYTGFGQSENFLIPKIVSHFVANEATIELGNLDVSREFNDIRMIIKIYYELMQCDSRSDIVNVCSGNTVTLKEVLEYMQEISGYKINIRINPMLIRKNEIQVLKGSVDKLKSIIAMPKYYQINDTLNMMYQAYKKSNAI